METLLPYRARSPILPSKIRSGFSLRLLLVFTLTILYFSLHYLYQTEISPSNLYIGFRFRPLAPWEMGSSLFFFLLPIIFLPVYFHKPSDLGVWCLYLFSYSPTAFIAFHVGKNGFFDTIALLLVMNCAFFLLLFFRRFKINFSIQKTFNWYGVDRKLLFFIFVLALLYVAYLGNFTLRLDFSSLYERRLSARETVGRGEGYFLSVCRSALTIIAVYMMVVKRKPMYFIFILLIALYIFSLDGTKGSVLNILFLTFVLVMLKRYKTILFFPITLVCLTISGILELRIIQTNVISEYLVRRILIVPGFLNTAFWEFFLSHEKVLLTDSIGKYFFGNVYDVSTAHLIGWEYFHDKTANANTGIWMGGFAHFGLFGVFFVSLLGGLLFGLIDNLLKTHFFLLGAVVCTYIGILWSEQMIHTSLMTGGIFYILVTLLFILLSKHLRLEFLHEQPHAR